MPCQNCQFWCDSEDVFCRKCGTTLVSEGEFKELEAGPHLTETQAAAPAEVISLATTNPTNIEPANQAAGLPIKAGAVTSKFLGLATKAISSQEGRAIIKGATVMAVSVGLELLSRSHQKPEPTKLAPINEPLNLADFAEPPQNLAPGTTIVETWMYRYTYTRRVVRRVR